MGIEEVVMDRDGSRKVKLPPIYDSPSFVYLNSLPS